MVSVRQLEGGLRARLRPTPLGKGRSANGLLSWSTTTTLRQQSTPLPPIVQLLLHRTHLLLQLLRLLLQCCEAGLKLFLCLFLALLRVVGL